MTGDSVGFISLFKGKGVSSAINTGIYLISNESLNKYIPKIGNKNTQSEYYLPDVFNFMIKDNLKAAIHKISNTNEISGINNKEQLLELSNYLKEYEKNK